MRLAAVAVGIGAVLAAAMRLRGAAPSAPRPGGWRELTDEDLLADSLLPDERA